MPNRILKESICSSDDIDQLSPFEETVFYRLIVNVDDYGRLDARLSFLRNTLYKTKESVTRKSIEDALQKLALIGLVKLYTVDEKPFLYLPKWECHQQVRAKKSRFPAPSEIICNQMISDDGICPRNPIQSESLSESKEEPSLSAAPPTEEKPKKVFADGSDEMKLSKLLAARMRQNNPSCKLPDDFQGWCKQMDLLMRRDGRTAKQVQDVIVWCQKDTFWHANILSAQKLREKFDQLVLKMQQTEEEKPQEGLKYFDH